MSQRPQFGMPNRYRRAFDWRLSEPQRDAPQIATAGLVGLATSELPDILEDFLDITRRRKANATALSKLQMWMLQEIVYQEGFVKHTKQRLDELRSRIGHEDANNPEVEAIKRQIFIFRTYANAIRAIGDGIAWRALDYDRAVIRLMCGKATKQNVVSEGLLSELQEWAIHFDLRNGIALLNSLTNCLAIGDVTVVRDDGSAEIVEVKSSKTKSSRKIRQKHRMHEVATLLSTGEGSTEEKQVTIEILPIEPQSGLDRLRDLLSESQEKGWAAAQVSNCLYVECIDFAAFENPQGAEDAWQQMGVKREVTIGSWKEREDLVIHRNSLDLMAFSPNCAPFSIFPFETRVCIDLLIGKKCYISHLNVNAVAQEFMHRGWEVTKTPAQLSEEGNYDSMLSVRKSGFRYGVPPADFMRMHMELLRPQTIISMCEAKLKQGPVADTGFWLGLYSGEPSLWD